MLFGRQGIGIDLGTANTIIAIDRKGIALREPSIVAINKTTEEIIAYGKEAQELVGRTSDNYKIVRPMRDGVIANFSYTKEMLSHYIKRALRRSLSRPEVVICVPSNISKLERKAVIDAIKDLGIRRAMIVDEPFAAALGAGMDINEPKGRLICDIGGGTTDIATISFGEIVHDHTLRTGGNKMNESIMARILEKYQLSIGFDEAETIKQGIGNALIKPNDILESQEVAGRNISTGIPQKITIQSEDILEALNEVIHEIYQGLKAVLEVTQPELAVDIMETGIVLTGGGSLLRNLPERLERELGIPVRLADKPLDCVAIGAGKMIRTMQKESKSRERNNG